MRDIITLHQELVFLKKAQSLLPPSRERRLTIPALFGRAYDENFLSDYLAYILDPNLNGVGIDPLRALLELVGRRKFKVGSPDGLVCDRKKSSKGRYFPDINPSGHRVPIVN